MPQLRHLLEVAGYCVCTPLCQKFATKNPASSLELTLLLFQHLTTTKLGKVNNVLLLCRVHNNAEHFKFSSELCLYNRFTVHLGR